jgi:signal peptide peptidase SppA
MVWPFAPSHLVVPVLRLEGFIAGTAGPRRGLNLATMEGALERAFGLRRAPAVALSINSPGGAAVQSHLIARRIRQLAVQKKRKVIAFIEDVGASGGYMLACAADEILVDPSSIVGSIGVLGGAGFGFTELLAKLGVERRVHKAGSVKARLDPFRPESPEDVQRLDEILRDVHDAFIGFVRERRAGLLKDNPMLFEGEIFTGREAVENGLADGFGDLHSVIAARYGEKTRVRRLPLARRPLAMRLLGGGADALLASLEERMAYARYGL